MGLSTTNTIHVYQKHGEYVSASSILNQGCAPSICQIAKPIVYVGSLVKLQ